jgi:hypothetical protein
MYWAAQVIARGQVIWFTHETEAQLSHTLYGSDSRGQQNGISHKVKYKLSGEDKEEL